MNDSSSLENTNQKEQYSVNNNEIKRDQKEPQSIPLLRIDRTDEPLRLNNIIHTSRMSSPETSPSPPSSPTLTRAILPRLYRLVKFSRFLILFMILFSIGSIYMMLDSFQHHQRDVSGCEESYMRPHYIKQTGFDSEMTRFAGKYGLYLYREKGVDFNDQVINIIHICINSFFIYNIIIANGCPGTIYPWSCW